MTGINEILKQFGLTVPQDRLKDFSKLFRDNYKSVAEVSKIKAARDNCMAQLEQSRKIIADYEESTAVLKNQIKELAQSIEKMQKNYGEKIAPLNLEYLLDLKILSAKAQSLKTVNTKLDV